MLIFEVHMKRTLEVCILACRELYPYGCGSVQLNLKLNLLEVGMGQESCMVLQF